MHEGSEKECAVKRFFLKTLWIHVFPVQTLKWHIFIRKQIPLITKINFFLETDY